MGYRRLVPIVPPEAELSPTSSLAKHPKCRGKVVGICGPSGKWFGFNWHQHETVEEDLGKWFAMGAGVGTRTGEGLIALDIDTLDETWSSRVEALAIEMLGAGPRRVGRAPKVLLPLRVVEADVPKVAYRAVLFNDGTNFAPGKDPRVELLCAGRQYVTGGIHPDTGKPYSWPLGVPRYDDLPFVTAEQIDAFFEALAAMLPASKAPRSGKVVDRTGVDQTALQGTEDEVARLVALIPNEEPDYESYRNMAAAIRGALQDDIEVGLDIYLDWCGRWSLGRPDPVFDERVFRSLAPPFALGIDNLQKQAAAATGVQQMPAERYFDVVPEGSVDTSAFSGLSATPEKQRQSASDTFALLGIDGLLEMSDPKYLIGRHLPENALGFLYGDPGTGKSFIALDWALHIAFGLGAWHGDPIDAPPDAHVVYIAGEGVAGLKSRVRAWMHRHAVEDARGQFSLLAHSVDLMDRDQLLKLARTIRAGAPGTVLVVVDTVSRSMPGADENQQREMTRFVQACDLIRSEFQCVVLGVHHAARQGGNMRGSTVLGGAGDFIFKLERKPSAVAGKLTCEKQKDAPDGWSEPYRFDTVAYPGGTSLVPTRCLTADGDGAPVPAAQEQQILEAIDQAWRSGEPWGQGAQSRDRYAVTQLVKEFGFDAGRAQELIQTLQDQGLIGIEVVDRKSKKAGYRRLATSSAPAPSGSVFD
ncbi:hypothetical protein ASF22_05000 [Methylobacterium sp. Leaf87]|nr:hypothetical protein ASF22_05000 [Methylobacterium sp. Leaf87]